MTTHTATMTEQQLKDAYLQYRAKVEKYKRIADIIAEELLTRPDITPGVFSNKDIPGTGRITEQSSPASVDTVRVFKKIGPDKAMAISSISLSALKSIVSKEELDEMMTEKIIKPGIKKPVVKYFK